MWGGGARQGYDEGMGREYRRAYNFWLKQNLVETKGNNHATQNRHAQGEFKRHSLKNAEGRGDGLLAPDSWIHGLVWLIILPEDQRIAQTTNLLYLQMWENNKRPVRILKRLREDVWSLMKSDFSQLDNPPVEGVLTLLFCSINMLRQHKT